MILLFSFVIVWSAIRCSKRVVDSQLPVKDQPASVLVNKIGQTSTFELATWNIEWFPYGDINHPRAQPDKTIEYVGTIIRNLDLDMIAVEEISSVQAFKQLLNTLSGWKGALSNDTYSGGTYQKTGILYKSSFISVSDVKNILTDDHYAFPRPPLSAYVTLTDLDSVRFNFNIIVVHLKAMGGSDNEARRKSACEKIKNYIDHEIAAGADSDFVVLGDWNDQLSDPASSNVFQVLLDDSADYSFLTKGIQGYSYISNRYKSMLDQILITRSVRREYDGGRIKILYLDNEFLSYKTYVSDHRPVMAQFKGFTLHLPSPE